MSTISREREIPAGMWPQVRAQLRSLAEHERIGDGDLPDGRMVEYWVERDGRTAPALIGCYAPLQEPEPHLLSEFLRVFGGDRLPSDVEVVEFYARYGPLRESVDRDGFAFPAWAARLSSDDQAKLSGEARSMLCEPLWWLRRTAAELLLTHSLYLALKEGRLAAVRSMLGRAREGRRLVGVSIEGGQVVRDFADVSPQSQRVGSFGLERHRRGEILAEVDPVRPGLGGRPRCRAIRRTGSGLGQHRSSALSAGPDRGAVLPARRPG